MVVKAKDLTNFLKEEMETYLVNKYKRKDDVHITDVLYCTDKSHHRRLEDKLDPSSVLPMWRGDALEIALVNLLRKFPDEELTKFAFSTSLVVDNRVVPVLFSPDATLGDTIIEIKTVRRLKKGFKPYPHHEEQLQYYIAFKPKPHGILLYYEVYNGLLIGFDYYRKDLDVMGMYGYLENRVRSWLSVEPQLNPVYVWECKYCTNADCERKHPKGVD